MIYYWKKTLKKKVKRLNILKYGKLTCDICKYPIKNKDRQFATIDHIKPICKGGTWNIKNLQVAHCICNERKGGK